MRRFALAVLAAAALTAHAPPPAAAQSSADAPDSYTVRSRSYEIVTNLTKDELRDLANHMDATHNAYERAFRSFGTKNAKRVRLYLWADREDYVRHAATIGFDARASGGVFFVREGEAGVSTWVRNQPKPWLHQVLQHEGFHQFAHLRFGRTLPLWVNEGLAVYFEHARLVDGQLVLGATPAHRIEEIRNAIESGTAFDFDDITNITSRQWLAVMRNDPNRAGIMYTQAWSLVHFLIHADNGKYEPLFTRYLRRIAQGRTHESAFEDAFGSAGSRGFEERWREYVLQELEPDPLTEAARRLEFLAEGLARLHTEGITPESIDQLKELLRARNFTVEHTHDTTRRVRPTDEMFEPPHPKDTDRRRRRGPEPTIHLKPANTNDDTPPAVAITGLKLDIAIRWSKDDRDNLTHNIVFD